MIGGAIQDRRNGLKVLSLVVLGALTLCACTERKIRKVLVQTNPGLRSDYGRVVRWSIPIPVSTSGIARADEAVDQIERATSGAIRFMKVQDEPSNGIVFVEGGAMNGDRSPGCGHVSGGEPGQIEVNFKHDEQGQLKGTYYVHLGSDRCADSTRGKRRSAVAEHELAHALGLATHFEDFTGNEGVSPDRVRSVLYSLYRNPIGITAEQLQVFLPPGR